MGLKNQWSQPMTRTVILKAGSYQQDLESLIRDGLKNYPDLLQRIQGRRVVLKPNLVEFYEAHRVNTNPAVIVAAAEAFRSLGAGEVIVAEGSGHQRDIEMLLEYSGMQEALRQAKIPFVDLNLDAIGPVPLEANYTGLKTLYLPHTILGADLVVSMPKLKTHHWAGVTLSMKNLFGVVPGVRYGWPKNVLHWRGITQSILDINLAVRAGFAIIDGVEAMEGDGPLFGDTVPAGVLIMGDHLPAVDATGARVMSIYPERIEHLRGMLRHGASIHESRIVQLGESIETVRRDFQVVPYQSETKKPLPFFLKWILGN